MLTFVLVSESFQSVIFKHLFLSLLPTPLISTTLVVPCVSVLLEMERVKEEKIAELIKHTPLILKE